MSAFYSSIFAFLRSSLGRKMIVAVTGLGLALFVLGHMAGNLMVYLGPEALNAYGHKLKSMGPLLWVARIGLLVMVGLHIYFTIKLTQENRSARGGESYAMKKPRRSTLGSRTMIVSGLILLAFIVFHVLQFTVHVGNEYGTAAYADFDLNGTKVHNVYAMVVHGFSSWLVSGFYILSMALLCLHLSHGVSSVFQTLGLSTQRTWPLYKAVGIGYALLIFVGNISIPLAVLFGIVK